MRCRRILVGLITAWVMLVCSCTSAPEKAAPGLIQKPTQAQGFYEPDPATYVMLMPSIREYFYNRKRAVVSGDMERFWQKYPQLKESMDLSRGINSESSLVHNMTDLKPVDGDIDIEHYERIAVKISQDHAEVLVHGLELYT